MIGLHVCCVIDWCLFVAVPEAERLDQLPVPDYEYVYCAWVCVLCFDCVSPLQLCVRCVDQRVVHDIRFRLHRTTQNQNVSISAVSLIDCNSVCCVCYRRRKKSTVTRDVREGDQFSKTSSKQCRCVVDEGVWNVNVYCVCAMWCSDDETGCHFGRQVARRALEVDLVAAKTQSRLHATTLRRLLIRCLLCIYVGGWGRWRRCQMWTSSGTFNGFLIGFMLTYVFLFVVGVWITCAIGVASIFLLCKYVFLFFISVCFSLFGVVR